LLRVVSVSQLEELYLRCKNNGGLLLNVKASFSFQEKDRSEADPPLANFLFEIKEKRKLIVICMYKHSGKAFGLFHKQMVKNRNRGSLSLLSQNV